MAKQQKAEQSNNTGLYIVGGGLGLALLYFGINAYASKGVSGTTSTGTGTTGTTGTGTTSQGMGSTGTGSTGTGTGGTNVKVLTLPQPYTDFEKQKAVLISSLSKRLCDDLGLDANYYAFTVGDIKDFYFTDIRDEIVNGYAHLYKLAGQFKVNFPTAEKEFEQVKVIENQVISYLKSVATYE